MAFILRTDKDLPSKSSWAPTWFTLITFSRKSLGTSHLVVVSWWSKADCSPCSGCWSWRHHRLIPSFYSDLLRSMSGKPCAGQICISFWHLFGTQDTEQHAHRQKQNIQSVWINAYGLWVPMGCLILVCSMFCPNLGSLGIVHSTCKTTQFDQWPMHRPAQDCIFNSLYYTWSYFRCDL